MISLSVSIVAFSFFAISLSLSLYLWHHPLCFIYYHQSFLSIHLSFLFSDKALIVFLSHSFSFLSKFIFFFSDFFIFLFFLLFTVIFASISLFFYAFFLFMYLFIHLIIQICFSFYFTSISLLFLLLSLATENHLLMSLQPFLIFPVFLIFPKKLYNLTFCFWIGCFYFQ